MSTQDDLQDWQLFVIEHGWRAQAYELAAVLGRTSEEVLAIRATGACARLEQGKGYSELFTLWHGRPPTDDEWPAPRKMGANETFEWQDPEVALLASLVGQVSVSGIAEVLTARLREKTGDPEAERTKNAVQVRINLIGLQASDVVGGLTTSEAARDINSLAIVNQMIAKGEIPAFRVGRLWVIPYPAWNEWKASRVFPPAGFVQLSSLKEALGIRSDKLSEFARMGLIPTATRCNPYGTRGPSTQFGTWWLSKEVADQLVSDRHAGKPMPWHGKCADNLKTTYKLWLTRQHPASCATCAQIWGEQGAPTTFEDYAARYPALAHGAKRHLTRPWTAGLTLEEVAAQAGRDVAVVRLAIENGVLAASEEGGTRYVSRTDSTRWCARHCPTGEGERSWMALKTASEQYLFSMRELEAFIESGVLKTKTGTEGAARGVVYVSRQQCSQLREKIGFTEDEAAKRLGITVDRFRYLLDGVDWRQSEKVPLVTVQAVRKRMESRHGYTIEEAASELGKTVQWVNEQIEAGAIRVSRAKWDRRRKYISEPMMKRLRKNAEEKAEKPEALGKDWLSLSDAAQEAGICTTTLIRWATHEGMARREVNGRWRYHREAVRAHARRYWKSVRFHRATPPAWL